MKRFLASLGLVAAFAVLSGCYYDPGYSYVRGSNYSGDAYYGQGSNASYVQPAYSGGYYDDGYYGSNGYYGGYGSGVSIGISSGWYGRGNRGDYRREDHDDRGGYHRGDHDDRGGYYGRSDDHHGGGDHRDHRDYGGNHQGRPPSSDGNDHDDNRQRSPSGGHDGDRGRGRDHHR